MALDAVRAGDQHQHVRRVVGAETRRIEIECLAVRAARLGIEPGPQRPAGCGRRTAEFRPCLRIAFGKAL